MARQSEMGPPLKKNGGPGLTAEQDAEQIARALNVLRTHYTTSQRAPYAAERANQPVGRRWPNSPKMENKNGVTAAREAGGPCQNAESVPRVEEQGGEAYGRQIHPRSRGNAFDRAGTLDDILTE